MGADLRRQHEQRRLSRQRAGHQLPLGGHGRRAQLERLEELVARKREIFSWYAEELRDESRVILNHEAADTRNTYWMVTAIVDPSVGREKEWFMEQLLRRGIAYCATAQ